jgi:drug/metabolite transporter (DMT)-like permease
MRLPPSYAAIATSTSIPDNGILGILKNHPYDESWSSIIGIVTAIVGNVLISFALNMQRYAHIRLDSEWQADERQRKRGLASGTNRLADESGKEPRRRDEASENDPLISQTRPSLRSETSEDSSQDQAVKQKSYLKSPYWWAGIVLMTVGEAGNFLAYGFAPASIVSPLGVVALISNCIIAPFMLKEPFRKRDALGVIVAVGGAVTVVLSANDNNPKLGPGEIWRLITTWEFETYLGVTVGVIALLMVASNKYGDKNILIDLGLVGLFGMCTPSRNDGPFVLTR